jgi:hypothetical protein
VIADDMLTQPLEITLEVNPCARFDVIDVREQLPRTDVHALGQYPRALYCSFHTTAGYLEQGLAARLSQRSSVGVEPYVKVFQAIFPEGAGYQHDNLHLRKELSEEQRLCEPRNADSHLAYIGAGLRNCVTYVNRPEEPVYFVDLDGVHGGTPRQRTTTVVGFSGEEEVVRVRLKIPVSAHPVESVNLKDPRLGLYDELQELITAHGVTKGRIQIALAPGERQAGLTVNEYETLLMRHDLAEVLRQPVRFMTEKGRNLLADPRAIPTKTIEYAKYDMVRVFNELFDVFKMRESLIEKVVARVLAVPASRFLRMKRSVSLLVSDREGQGGRPVQGIYQSPILVQWEKAKGLQREVEIVLTSFK